MKVKFHFNLGYDKSGNKKIKRELEYDMPIPPTQDMRFKAPFDDFDQEVSVEKILFNLETGKCHVFLKDPYTYGGGD